MIDRWSLLVLIAFALSIYSIFIFLKKRTFSNKLLFVFFILFCLNMYISVQHLEHMRHMG